jgi:predicted kinase
MEDIMAKVTFVLGLCGSGKSYLAQQMGRRTGERVFENLLSDASALPVLLACLKEGKDCIVDDVRFCLPEYRNEILHQLSQISGVEIHWVCYENDLESANWNVMHRTDKGDPQGHLDINLRLHAHYEYPAGAAVIPIQRI